MSAPADSHATWRAGVAANRLVAWNAQQLSALGRGIGAALSAWGADWGLGAAWLAAVECKAATAAGNEAAPWCWMAGSGDAAVWRWWTSREPEQLASALFGGSVQLTPMVAEIGQACWDDAVRRLRSLLLAQEGDAPADPSGWTLSSWSGAVIVGLPWGARLLLGPALVRRVLAALPAEPRPAVSPPSRPPLSALDRALADTPVQLQVQLDGCDLDVGTLQDLQIGDVLRLRHGIDAPAAVACTDGVPLFHGFLARSRGRKAVELAPAAA